MVIGVTEANDVCSGGHCHNYCYSYGCPGGYRTVRPGYVYPFVAAGVGTRATVAQLNSIRNAIFQEYSERSMSRKYSNLNPASITAAKGVDTEAIASHINSLRVNINAIIGNVIATNVAVDSQNMASYITEMQTAILNIMRDCVCYTDCGSDLSCDCYNDCDCYY
jgi:hypothetical protein